MNSTTEQQIAIIRAFLEKMRTDEVRVRRDLYHYYIRSDTDAEYNANLAELKEILLEKGWVPLDPFYDMKAEWQNAKMILTPESIDTAIDRLKIDNGKWSYGLFTDFKDLYDEKMDATVDEQVYENWAKSKDNRTE